MKAEDFTHMEEMLDSIAIFPFLIIPKASVNKVVVAAYRATAPQW